MTYRVFAQRAEPRVDLAALMRAVQTHFRSILELDVVSESSAAGGMVHTVEVAVRLPTGHSGTRSLLARRGSALDQDDAETAERIGQAAGMAALAARCPVVIEVTAPAKDAAPVVGQDDEPALTLRLCAALAATHLGPILPPNEQTLFGVRGANERAEALLKGD